MRESIRDALADNAQDADGWADIPLDDGGELRLCACRLDEDPQLDGVTLVIDNLTPGLTNFVYRFLDLGEMVLLPLMIATRREVAARIDTPWPQLSVIDAAPSLFDILSAGPVAWCEANSVARVPWPSPKGQENEVARPGPMECPFETTAD